MHLERFNPDASNIIDSINQESTPSAFDELARECPTYKLLDENFYGFTALTKAVVVGNTLLLNHIIKIAKEIGETKFHELENDITTLIFTTYLENEQALPLAKILLESQANLNRVGKRYNGDSITALSMAAENKNKKLVKLFLRYKATIPLQMTLSSEAKALIDETEKDIEKDKKAANTFQLYALKKCVHSKRIPRHISKLIFAYLFEI